MTSLLGGSTADDRVALSGISAVVLSDADFVRQAAIAISKITNKDDKERIARSIGGARNVAAMAATGDFSSINLPRGSGALTGDMSNAAQADAETARTQTSASQNLPIAAEIAEFKEASRRGLDSANDVAGDMPWAGWGGTFANTLTGGRDKPTDKEVGAAFALGTKLLELAQLREDIAQGKRKASPQQIKQLEAAMSGIQQKLGSTGSGPIEALVKGKSSEWTGAEQLDWTRQGQLQQAAANKAKYLAQTLRMGQGGIHSAGEEIAEPNAGGALFKQADEIQNSLQRGPIGPPAPAAPATQPAMGPHSTNYHTYNQRIVNYGMGFGAIGAPEDWGNNFG